MPDNLNHYLASWNLANSQPLAQTATSHLYTVEWEGKPAVLKMLTYMGEEEAGGAVALRLFDGHGAVRLYRHDENAHLLEYAPGDSLIPLVQRGDDEEATHIIAAVLNQLHTARTFEEGLTPLTDWFRSLFLRAEQDKQNGETSVYTRAAPVAEKLLAEQRDQVVLHGDMHHDNVRLHPERGWLAFDPKALYGERAYDAANTLCNPVDTPALVLNEARLLRNAGILADELNIPLERILVYTYAYACLSASWSSDDGRDASLALGVAAIVEGHVAI